eukprot:CAMPEP_0171505034 /NCGR_PEP_ID=MMETSP0958-20121227/11957_1 /TAXON_ID=87120 /ORGANISM="Aurantiochytrium limacinum, Strain ATCCMYA-1381" /LENGTH=56 /DNA_ID=CAMNT_0012041051 /DNA_START=187 /DNA_END=354 /DNA_ORIENTATION=-
MGGPPPARLEQGTGWNAAPMGGFAQKKSSRRRNFTREEDTASKTSSGEQPLALRRP